MTSHTAFALEARSRRIGFDRVLLAAVVLGTLDGLCAWLLYRTMAHVGAMTLFQGIARALLGMAAFTGGATTALVGLALHFGVALAWATTYAVLYARSELLRQLTRPAAGALAIGAASGLVIHLAMTFLIVPLTRIGAPTMPAPLFLAQLVIHMLVVGPPLVLLIRE